MPIQQISPAEAAIQRGAEGVIYQDTTNPGLLYVKGPTGFLAANALNVPSLQALVSGGGIPGLRSKPAASGVVRVVGDSIGWGSGLASPSSRFGALVAAGIGGTEVNYAAPATVCGRWAAGITGSVNTDNGFGSAVMGAGDSVLMMVGFNDANNSGTAENALYQFRRNLLASLLWLGIPEASKVYSQTNATTLNPACTFVGSWTASVGFKGRGGAYTLTANDTVSATVTGNTVYVALGSHASFSSKVQILIDGALYAPTSKINLQAVIALTDGGDDSQPYVLVIPGLSSGAHTVTVKCANSTGGQYLTVAFIAGCELNSTAKPCLYVAGAIDMTPTGYALTTAGSLTASRTYRQVVSDCVAAANNSGALVTEIDLNSDFLLSADMLADNVHPSELWHKLTAGKFLDAIRRTAI